MVRWCFGAVVVVGVKGQRSREVQKTDRGCHTRLAPLLPFRPSRNPAIPPAPSLFSPRQTPPTTFPVPPSSLCRLPPREFSRQTTDRESIHLSPIARRPPPFRQPFLNTIPLVESDAVTNNALPPARAVVISASRFPTISTTYIPHSRAEWSRQWPTRGGSDMARPPPPGGRRPSTTRRAHRCPSPALATIPSTPETSTWSQPTTSIPTTTTNTNPSPEAPSSVATPSPPPRHTRQGKNPWAEARA